MARTGEVTFTDEVMSGGGVCRRYSDGVEEWRWRDPDGTVWWRDNRQRYGTDEPVGPVLIKRTHVDGHVLYGRDGGFGLTVWSDGRRTLNATDLSPVLLALLVAVGFRALGHIVPAPPPSLSPSDEQRLRERGAPRGKRKDRREDDDTWTRDDYHDEHRDDFG
jgi:hypothetical protein